jgi:glycosyltransferase involved in cell wall biosynthesis
MAAQVKRALTRDELAVFEAQTEPFFLCAGALVPYKRVDVAVDACSKLGVPLWVVGKGPERAKLEGRAGKNVRFFGHVSEGFLWECYQRCRALLFPGVEDFGIVPVECLSSGRPVVAIQAGGVAETVDGELVHASANDADALKGQSGVFLPKTALGSVAAFADAIRYCMRRDSSFDTTCVQHNAQRFDYATFFRSWRRFAERVKIPVESAQPSAADQEMACTSPAAEAV